MKKAIPNHDGSKIDKKHLQTRFPRPAFGQQVRFSSFLAARLRPAGRQK